MVATTAVQGLRYPQTTDAPCDGDLHLGWFASDVEVKVDSHEADLARTLAPPTLIMTQSQPIIYDPFILPKIAFDVVEQQTGGSFGLFDANPEQFRMPRTGYYQVGLHLNWPQSPSEITLALGPAFNLTQFDQASVLFGGQGLQTDIRTSTQPRAFITGDYTSLAGFVQVTTTEDYWAWELTVVDFVAEFEITFARMYAIWTGDL